MEKLSSILDSVKERLSSPLFGSYAISWILWNWRIPVALLWFDTNQLHSTASWNYADYISSQLSQSSWTIPALFAAGYTILLPVSRWVTATVIKVGNDLVFKASKESKVSFENYYTVLQGNEDKAKKLEEMIGSQETLQKTYDASITRTVDLQREVDVKSLQTEAVREEKRVLVEQHNIQIEQINQRIDKINADHTAEINRLNFEHKNQQISLDRDYKQSTLHLEQAYNQNKRIAEDRIKELSNVLDKAVKEVTRINDLANDRQKHLEEDIKDLKEEHLKEIEILKIEKSNEIIEVLEGHREELEKLRNHYEARLLDLNDKIDSSVLNGIWERSSVGLDFMHEKRVIIINNEEFNTGSIKYPIISFRKTNKEVSFIVKGEKEIEFYILGIYYDHMAGNVNGKSVTFSRITPSLS